MNMEKRSAKHKNESVVNSAHKSTTNFDSLEKQSLKQNLPVLNPYIKIERLDLETPHTKQTDKKGKKATAKCESSEESESNSEESCKENEIPIKQTNTMSDYEKLIQKNIEEKREMFEKMVGAVKREILQDKTNRAAQNARKRKVQTSVAVPRKSSRIIDGNSPIKYKEEAAGSTGLYTMDDPKMKYKSIEDKTFFKNIIPILEKKNKLVKLPANQLDFLNVMKSFSISEKGVAKVSKTQINCLAWHPSNYKLLVAVGSSDGNVGFWDIDKLEDKYQGVREFNRVHSQAINCINFDKFNPMRLLTSGNDGFVRFLDLHSNVWDKITSRIKDRITCHAQKNRSSLLISVKGNVSLIDLRTKEVESKIQCFSVRNGTCTVSLHPQDENLFLTFDRSGEMGIFDMRYTVANDFAVPVVPFPKAPKRVNGTFFSPITGRYVLTSYADDTVKLYDVQNYKFEPECIKSIYHCNHVEPGAGKLRQFKAVWHPQREDVFIIGSRKQPYRIELYDAPSGALLHKFKGDSLDSSTSINLFHPTAPVFAACKFGEIFIFRS